MSDIKNIVENIESNVLVIGPGVFLDKDGKSLQAGFAERYSLSNKGLIRHYFEHDNLFRPKNSMTRITIQKNFADFYKNEFSRNVLDLYRKIAQIPYPLIISFNPDNTLISCYEELGSKYAFDFYIKGKKNLINEIPTKDNPYLFNLLGCYTEPESMILTYNDLFEYLRNILPGDSLPTSIRTFLRNAGNITFLGVEFDKWYFQLLVKLLTEFDEKYELLRYAAPDLSSNSNINSICENNFEITFVGPDVFNFVNELYYHCSTHEYNTLRGKPILTEGKIFNPEIFISYKHSGESDQIAEKLFEKGKESGFNIIIDKANLEFKGRIWDFMKRIGWGKYIIVIIRDAYLKSEYCMFEFKEIMRNGVNFEDRVFPIVLADADIYKEYNWKKYEQYWKEEIEKLKFDLKDMESDRLFKSVDSIKRYEEILKSIPSMMDFLGNILTYHIQEEETFIPLFNAINDKINTDLTI
jgi:hypothetical protein